MSDSKIIGTPPGERHLSKGEPARVRRTTEGWEAYSSGLNRSQGSAGGGRHAAIARNLDSWSHYKTWADKVRNSWDRDK